MGYEPLWCVDRIIKGFHPLCVFCVKDCLEARVEVIQVGVDVRNDRFVGIIQRSHIQCAAPVCVHSRHEVWIRAKSQSLFRQNNVTIRFIRCEQGGIIAVGHAVQAVKQVLQQRTA